MDLRTSSFDGSTFDGRDLFGFLAEGSQFDSDVGVPYDISADFVSSDATPSYFDNFYLQEPQQVDETELVSLMYQGYVFAKRIVTIRKASDPSYPLPFFFPDDRSKHVYYAGTCTVIQDSNVYNTILCIPLYDNTASTQQDTKRKKISEDASMGRSLLHDGSQMQQPMTSNNGMTQTRTWEVIGIFREDSPQKMSEVNNNRNDVLRLLLDVFTDMPSNAHSYFSSLLVASSSVPTAAAAAATAPVVVKTEPSVKQEIVQNVSGPRIPQYSAAPIVPNLTKTDSVSEFVRSTVMDGTVIDPVEQKILEVLELANNLWKDLTESDNEQRMSWPAFVERFCANPCNIMQTTPSVVSSLHSLFCPDKSSSIVTLESWQRFVCMFWVARPSDALVVYNWSEADALLDQPWFCGMLDKASAQSALSRSTRPCSEFLIRCSDTLWRYGVFVLSKSFPDHDVCHTRIARHRPGEPEYLTLTRAGIPRFADLSTSQFVYGMTGERARMADMFYYAVPFADNPKPTRTVWSTLNALVADLNEHYKAQGFQYPLLPCKGMTSYHD